MGSRDLAATADLRNSHSNAFGIPDFLVLVKPVKNTKHICVLHLFSLEEYCITYPICV